MKLDTRQF